MYGFVLRKDKSFLRLGLEGCQQTQRNGGNAVNMDVIELNV